MSLRLPKHREFLYEEDILMYNLTIVCLCIPFLTVYEQHLIAKTIIGISYIVQRTLRSWKWCICSVSRWRRTNATLLSNFELPKILKMEDDVLLAITFCDLFIKTLYEADMGKEKIRAPFLLTFQWLKDMEFADKRNICASCFFNSVLWILWDVVNIINVNKVNIVLFL